MRPKRTLMEMGLETLKAMEASAIRAHSHAVAKEIREVIDLKEKKDDGRVHAENA